MISRIRVTGAAFWAFAIILLGAVSTLVWWLFLSDAFRINKVEISGNAFITDKEIDGYLSQHRLIGKHVWFADLPGIAKGLANNPRIVSATFERDFPNRIRLVIEEAVEFATVILVGGRTVIIDPDGRPIRELRPDEGCVGPLICGFSEKAIECEPPQEDDLTGEREIWAGLASDPFIAAKVKTTPAIERRDILREAIRYAGALKLAQETRLDRGRVLSGYDYIGLDGNYDLFLSYDNMPPMVLGGFINARDIVMELNEILDYDNGEAPWGKYDYIDLHMPEYPRGIILAELGKAPRREWSNGDEAMTVALWKIMVEVDNRLGK